VRHYAPTEKQVAAGKRAARAQSVVNPDRDNMFAAMAKLGGINADAIQRAWGVDKNDLRNAFGAGVKRVATSKGMSIDAMAERLAELGYLSRDQNGKHDNAEFEDLFNGELSGSKHYTPEGYGNTASDQQQAEYEDFLSRQDAEESGYTDLPEQAQDAIEWLKATNRTGTASKVTPSPWVLKMLLI